MTIAFPRAMPDSGPADQYFEPNDVNLESAVTGGALYGVAIGEKRWRSEWTLGQGIGEALSEEWRAFIGSLNGSNRSFLGRDYRKPYPRLYLGGFAGLTRAGGGVFDGSLTSWSQTIATDGQALATLHGLPAAFRISRGDLMDFRWTTLGVGRRHLVRFLEDATADGSGVITAISVDPPIHVRVVPGGAVAHLDQPCCVMRMITASSSIAAVQRRGVVAGTKLVAGQDLRP